jgi:hypothetical protein
MYSQVNAPYLCTLRWTLPTYVLSGERSLLMYSQVNAPYLGTLRWTLPTYVLSGERSLLMHSRVNTPYLCTLRWTLPTYVLSGEHVPQCSKFMPFSHQHSPAFTLATQSGSSFIYHFKQLSSTDTVNDYVTTQTSWSILYRWSSVPESHTIKNTTNTK